MSVIINVQIRGLDKLRKNIARYPQISTPIYNKAIKEGSALIEKGSKNITPVDTGALKKSHRVKLSNLRGEIRVGGGKVDYHLYVHEGTRKMAARPFLKNATDRNTNKINDLFEKAGEEITKKLAKK